MCQYMSKYFFLDDIPHPDSCFSLRTRSHLFLKIILRYIFSFIENILSEVDGKND